MKRCLGHFFLVPRNQQKKHRFNFLPWRHSLRFTVTDAVQLIAGGTVIGAVAEVDDDCE